MLFSLSSDYLSWIDQMQKTRLWMSFGLAGIVITQRRRRRKGRNAMSVRSGGKGGTTKANKIVIMVEKKKRLLKRKANACVILEILKHIRKSVRCANFVYTMVITHFSLQSMNAISYFISRNKEVFNIFTLKIQFSTTTLLVFFSKEKESHQQLLKYVQ